MTPPAEGPAPDPSPADWVLVAARRDPGAWSEVARWGPPGFAAYVRVDFRAEDGLGEGELFRRVFASLAAHTTTPDTCWACVWEGWGGADEPRDAPVVEIPHRRSLLFRAPVDRMVGLPARAWGEGESDWPAPHLAWPEDRAWCVACDVDEDWSFGVGCSQEAADALAADLGAHVRPAAYASPERLWADQPWPPADRA